MLKRFLAVLVVLAAPAWAQVGVPKVAGGGGGSTTVNADTIVNAIVCTDSVGTDAYACSAAVCPSALADQQVVVFEAGTLNTGAATFAFCGFAAKAVVKYIGAISTALATGDILAKQPVAVRYDLGDDNWKMFSYPASVVDLSSNQTITAAKSMSGTFTVSSGVNVIWSSAATFGKIGSNTVQTPDTIVHTTGTLSNCLNVLEEGDVGSDLNNGAAGTAAAGHPCINLHSTNNNTTEYQTLSAWGSAGGMLKALTESSATALVRIPVANNSRAGGELHYEIYATDGTDMQVRSSRIRYAMTNKAGTEACNLAAMDGAAANAETNDDNVSSITSGTLTYAIACTNNAADTMDITFAAVSSLAQTTLQAKYSVRHLSPGAPVPQ